MRIFGGSAAPRPAAMAARSTPSACAAAAAASALCDVVAAGDAQAHAARAPAPMRSVKPHAVDAARRRSPRRARRGRRRTRPRRPAKAGGGARPRARRPCSRRWSRLRRHAGEQLALGRARRRRALPTPSRWAGPTLVMTPTSGAAISVRRAISPDAFMPISSTATASSPARRKSVSGTPTRLFSLPCVLSTRAAGQRLLEDRGEHLLGGRLAVAAGDGDHAPAPAAAGPGGEIAERAQGVGDDDGAHRDRRRPAGDRPAPRRRRAPARRRRRRGRRGSRRAARRTDSRAPGGACRCRRRARSARAPERRRRRRARSPRPSRS